MSWRNGLIVSCLLAILTLLGGCKEERVSVGAKAPALAAYDLIGQPVDLTRWQGKSVYLNFWSSGCGGCLAEMGTLEKLSKDYADSVVVVAVNTDPDSVDISPLVDQQNISYPVIRDQLGITQERYQVIGTPTSFIIDGNGNVTAQHQGARDEQQLTALFERLAHGA
ncbi:MULTISPECIES: TlpA family protein disulfide reductase [unclassified Brenneria]|uniref:TlpA family protein disulfide reductase n=1 Tax=unclassified Brenneria TaxID=2634434 RepID=UPI001556207B|nr:MULTISPECIES: TlpA disulfide reductase family protein [unclassified Brenneria]MBJ7220287.1 TlpA family protein disulfide reductase [Brenneria sp. L3-3C-1]MEE3641532.1 TlpA disulfide reductase family protein [Brenneria sp. L3_3C_1]MEE3649837.1 TlpA disulfide reductase family protein [Brenneria sp. HEZEL_4_2_4]NPC99796.1 TlpA family protein disulfide reductase [Brenneria sp. hezel4-2-4]